VRICHNVSDRGQSASFIAILQLFLGLFCAISSFLMLFGDADLLHSARSSVLASFGSDMLIDV